MQLITAVAFTFTIAISYLAPTAVNAQEAQAEASAIVITPNSRGLTIDECLKLVQTETDEEFNWDETDETIAATASDLWQSSNTFEWSKAYVSEKVSKQKFPYLLCHIGTNPDGSSPSGYQRKLALADAINYDENSDDKFYVRPLYNNPDYLCVYSQLLASVAANVTGEDFVTQPVVPSLKHMKGTVDKLYAEVKNSNSEKQKGGDAIVHNPSLDIVLGPGVAIAEVEYDENGNEIQIGSTTTVWEDVPLDIVAADIIADLVPTKDNIDAAVAGNQDGKNSSSWSDRPHIPISETYYLTSKEYIAGLEEIDAKEATARSKLWKDMIETYQQSGECDEIYAQRLKWTIVKTNNPEHTSSIMNVEFNTTGDDDLDVGCMLTLSLAIAAHPNVASLEARERMSTSNTIIQWLTQSELGEKRPFFDAGLDGDGQVVTISDTGVDRDHCYFYDEDNDPNSYSVNLEARKITQYVDFVNTMDYQYGHGTHVAGTVAGKRKDGNGMAEGVAPGAKIAFADIGDQQGGLSLPLDKQLLGVGRPHAKIHSASWGSELSFYTTQAYNFDQYMYENDDFLIMVAAGNSGYDDKPYTVGSPATAKNIIAVGAHHNTGSSTPKHGLGPSYIADFSSRGPTSDGRTKPDLLAPGKAVLSAGAQPDEFGECDPGKVPNANGKSDGVLSLQGTSMATPVVSGTAAIIRQYFAQGYYPTGIKTEENIAHPNPSGALVKAVLMNGAQFLRGVDNGGRVTSIEPYDNNQNFGRLALQHSVYIPGKTDVQLQAWDRQVVYDQKEQPYEVTIDKSNTFDNLHLNERDSIYTIDGIPITSISNARSAFINAVQQNHTCVPILTYNAFRRLKATVMSTRMLAGLSGGNLYWDSKQQQQMNIRDVYNVHEKLGEGAFAVVRKATHKETGDQYALKIVNRASLNKNVEASLKMEISILKELKHEHIMQLNNDAILSHPWIREDKRKLMTMSLAKSQGELKRYIARMRFKKAIHSVVFVNTFTGANAVFSDKNKQKQIRKLEEECAKLDMES